MALVDDPDRRSVSPRRQSDMTFEELDRRIERLHDRMTEWEQHHESQLRIDLMGTDARPGGWLGRIDAGIEAQRLAIEQLRADAKVTAIDQAKALADSMSRVYVRVWWVLGALLLFLFGVIADLLNRVNVVHI